MSVKKTKSEDIYEHGECCAPMMGRQVRKIFYTLLGILLVYIIVWLATLIRNNIARYEQIGIADRAERVINITADGKVTAKPDIAMITVGMVSRGKTVAEAQQENTKIMNTLLEKMKALGINEKDTQTSNYSIYPQYSYEENKAQTVTGYEVNQNVEVKIRDVQKANQVLASAGDVGANSVGGLQFTIDNPEVYLREARQKALQKIADKKLALEQSLGIQLGDIVSYYENEGGGGVFPSYKTYGVEESIGGSIAPQIQAGSMDIVLNVNASYELY